MLTLAACFARVIPGITCHRQAPTIPSKYMGGGFIKSRSPYRSVLLFFISGSSFFSLRGLCLLGGSRDPFSWPETGRTFRDHGGSPRLSAPQGDRFLGAKSVTIFWARNRALVAPVFLIFGVPKRAPGKYLVRGPVHPKICPPCPYQGDRRTSLSSSIRFGPNNIDEDTISDHLSL